MRKLVSIIFDRNADAAVRSFNRQYPEAQQQEGIPIDEGKYGGKICIEYNCENGQFYVSADVLDASEMSIELLARTCFQIENGTIDQFVYQALSVWAEEDPAKLLFMEEVSKRLEELRKTEVGDKKLAIHPSKVFDFRNIK